MPSHHWASHDPSGSSRRSEPVTVLRIEVSAVAYVEAHSQRGLLGRSPKCETATDRAADGGGRARGRGGRPFPSRRAGLRGGCGFITERGLLWRACEMDPATCGDVSVSRSTPQIGQKTRRFEVWNLRK